MQCRHIVVVLELLSRRAGLVLQSTMMLWDSDPGDAAGKLMWGWPMAMMAVGLQRQLGRCNEASAPDFCSDSVVHPNVLAAYNHLWDLIEANSAYLSYELWSWQYNKGGFQFAQYGMLFCCEQGGQRTDISQVRTLRARPTSFNSGHSHSLPSTEIQV